MIAVSSVPRKLAITVAVVADLGGGSLGDDPACIHGIDPVAQTHEHGHVVLDNQDRTPQLVADAAYQRPESLGFALGHSCGRLVEQQQDGGSDATCAARSQIRRMPVESSEVSASAHGPRPKASTISSARRRLLRSPARTQGAPTSAGKR